MAFQERGSSVGAVRTHGMRMRVASLTERARRAISKMAYLRLRKLTTRGLPWLTRVSLTSNTLYIVLLPIIVGGPVPLQNLPAGALS